jgi:uncharacterized protein YjbI with pentapeptide repeats
MKDRLRSMLMCLLVVVGGCKEISPTNPFDPATPASQQQPGTLVVRLTLPEGFDAAALEDGPSAMLTDPAAPAGNALTAALTPADDGTALVLRVGGVAPGDYVLSFAVAPLRHVPIAVHMPVGGATVTLPPLALEAPDAAAPLDPETAGLLVGRARREEGGTDGHAGVDVRVVGTPYTTRTAADGAYALAVPPGVYTLTAEDEAHGAEVTPEVRAVAGETTAVPDLILSPLPGRVRVDVRLGAGVTETLLEQVRVTLSPAEAGAGGADGGAGEPPDTARIGGLASTQVTDGRARGAFLFDEVTAGRWQVRAQLTGFLGDAAEVVVEPGREAVAPTLDLSLPPAEPMPGVEATRVEGRVRVGGVVGDAGHGGSRVEVEGTAIVGFTADDGAFELVVPARPLRVVASRSGHAGDAVALDAVPEGERTRLPRELVLVPLPGEARGLVELSRHGSADRLAGVVLRLFPAEPADAASVAQASPDAAGRVSLRAAPGDYRVETTARGFATVRVPLTLTAGGISPLGTLLLRHRSETAEAVALAGEVLLAVAGVGAAPAGTTVRIVDADRGEAFASTTTDAGGRFSVPAAPDETYLIAVERDGFEPLPLDGPVAWDAQDARFERAGEDAELRYRLTPAPFSGRLTVSYRVAPDWVPPAQVRAVVEAVGDAGTLVVADVSPGEDAVLALDTAGTYLVRVSAPGFAADERIVALDAARAEATVSARLVLARLAEAGLDLGAMRLSAEQLGGVELTGAALDGVTLTGDFASLSLADALLVNADLTEAELAGATLAGADLRGADLTGVDLTGADLHEVDAFGARFNEAVLMGANLEDADFGSATLERATFSAAAEGLPAAPCAPGADRPGVRMGGAHFSGASLAGATLDGVDLRATDLTNAALTGASLRRTCLRGGTLTLTNLSEAILDGADLGSASLVMSVLQGVSARGADLRGTRLISSVLEGARLGCRDRHADGRCACEETFEEADPGGACADPDVAAAPACRCRTRLADANLNGANLAGADLSGADLARVFGVQVASGDAAGVPAFQPEDCVLPPGCPFDPVRPPACQVAAGRACMLRRTDFAGARLDGAELPGLLFAHADLTGATFRGANLTLAEMTSSTTFDFADFEGATLTGGRLAGARLRTASFSGADLTGADLEACDARGADFAGARLERTKFTDALIAGADFRGATLRDTDLTVAADTAGRPLDLTGADLAGEHVGWTTARGDGVVSFAAVRLDEADLRGAVFDREPVGDLTGRSLRSADLTGADLSGLGRPEVSRDAPESARRALVGGDLTGAVLDRVRLPAVAERVILDGARLSGLDTGPPPRAWTLTRTRLSGADLRGRGVIDLLLNLTDARRARLGGASTGDSGGLSATLSRLDGAEVEARGLSSIDLTLCDLRAFDLPAVLSVPRSMDASIRLCDLRGLDFRGRTLQGGGELGLEFIDVDLRGARFDGATLGWDASPLRLVRALLQGASFNGAVLEGVSLEYLDLLATDLTNARLRACFLEQTAPNTAAARAGLVVEASRWEDHAREALGADLDLDDTPPCAFTPLSGAAASAWNFSRARLACREIDHPVESSFVGGNLAGARIRHGAGVVGLGSVSFALADLRGAALTTALTAASLRGADLTGATVAYQSPDSDRVSTLVDLTDARLPPSGLTLQSVDLTTVAAAALARHTVVGDVVLWGADARGFDASLGVRTPAWQRFMADDADFTGVTTRALQIRDTSLARARFARSDLVTTSFDIPYGTLFQRVFLDDAAFEGADLRRATFHRTWGRCASFAQADLRGAALMSLATGGCADFSQTRMDGAVFRGPVTHTRVNQPLADTLEAREIHADLRGVTMAGAELAGVDLSGLDLREVDLSASVLDDVDLRDAILTEAELSGATLRGADLAGAVLTEARLRDADLTDADLRGAAGAALDLSGATLSGADLTGARFMRSSFVGADLRGVVGLRAARLGGADLTDARLCLSERDAIAGGVTGRPLLDPGC